MKKTKLAELLKKSSMLMMSAIFIAFIFFGPGSRQVFAEEPLLSETQEEETETVLNDLDLIDTVETDIDNEVIEDTVPEDIVLEASVDTVSEVYITDEEESASLEDYIDHEVSISQGNVYYASSMAGSKLSGNNKIIYDKLKSMAADIANGNRDSAVCKISLSELGLNKEYTASDLGLTGSQRNDSMAGFNAMLNIENYKSIDAGLIANALRADCPYEAYWMGLSSSAAVGRVAKYDDTIKGYKWRFDDDFEFRISVSKDYQGNNGEYSVNTNKTKAVKNSVNKINSIINEAKSKNDNDKIQFYKDQICGLTDYNTNAMKLPSSSYGDPWQLVYVFDGDANTKVVCEGYSKAFDYLCEKTVFSDSSINCYSVTGTLNNEPHMWNIIHWSDKANYMVDVTNCDSKNTNDLFMALPTSGNVTNGYYFTYFSNYSMYYNYDANARKLFTQAELTIDNSKELTDITIEYNSNIQSRTNIPFTVKKEGGSYSCQFKLDYVEDEKGTKIVVYSTDYSSQNNFNVTFPKGGKYTLKFSAKDRSKTVSKTITVDVKKGESEQVEEFVERFYNNILDRQSEPAGLENWTVALMAGTRGGADVADEFIHSAEYQGKTESDEVYLTRLYLAFFGRQPDAKGMNSWKEYLASGKSRDDVLYGFLVSEEYKELCAKYGIKRDSTRSFTRRFYKLILERPDDKITPAELDVWQNALDAKTISGSDMTREWINRTPEFQLRKISNEEFVKLLYRVLFNRDADPSGLATWTSKLNSGTSRAQVLEEIMAQPEFASMCAEYGINP